MESSTDDALGEPPMAISRRRLPFWLVLATVAVAFQAVSLFVAPTTRYEIAWVRPCASAKGSACLMGMLQPTHPYLWIAVGLYLVVPPVMPAPILFPGPPQHRLFRPQVGLPKGNRLWAPP